VAFARVRGERRSPPSRSPPSCSRAGAPSAWARKQALLPLAGRPLIAHVVERLRPQVAELVINANGEAARFASLDCAVVAALAFARRRGFSLLATAPCDAP
jgi:molybdopterin-guanine dinucleotide biosynthesis protein A